MKLIETNSRPGYTKLRVVVSIGRDLAKRYGWEADDELEAVPVKDGLLIRRPQVERHERATR